MTATDDEMLAAAYEVAMHIDAGNLDTAISVMKQAAFAAKAEPAGAWWDISAAPRDGTLIVGMEYDADSIFAPLIRVVWWNDYGCWDFGDSLMDNPTHWMPLPTPPQQNIQGGSNG